jgi:hypothetical protein
MNNENTFNHESVDQYERLRLFAIAKDATQWHQGYGYLVHKGMLSWLIEGTVTPIAVTNPHQSADLQQMPQSQITQTIIDILIKRTGKQS